MVGLRTAARTCQAVTERGEPCAATPLRDDERCFWHSAATAKEAAEARRLGGMRRRREGTLQGAYEFEGLDSVARIRRLLEVAAADALGLDNSIARVRALVAVSQAAAKLLEVGELEERLEALETAVHGRGAPPPSVFDLNAHAPDIVSGEGMT